MHLIDIIALAAVAVLVVLWLTRKKTGIVIPGVGWSGGGPATVSVAASAWDFRYGTGISGHPTQEAAGFSFLFPTSGDVDYLTTNVSINAGSHVHCVAKVEAVSGSPMFVASDGGSPATFGVILEVRGDDMVSEDGRWWARVNRGALWAPGNYTFDVPLTDLSRWSNVQGRIASDRPAQFRDAIANLGAVGLTFGAISFGHGVSVSGGTAKMTVTEFSVQ
jgi:hypothetical protein